MNNSLAFLLFFLFGCFIILTGCDSEQEILETSEGNNKTQEVTILAYHNLTKDEPESGSEIKTKNFADQMEYLYKNDYNTLSLQELFDYYMKGYFPEKSVVITFDDGYKSFYTKAYPILKEYNFNAAVFPIVSLTPGLERKIVWVEHLTFNHMRLMDEELICFGSHTYDLHYYTDEDQPAVYQKSEEDLESYKERIKKDLRVSKDLLELQTDQEIISLAWPFGVETDTAREIALDLDYKILFTITEEPFSTEMSLEAVPRFCISQGSIEELREILKE